MPGGQSDSVSCATATFNRRICAAQVVTRLLCYRLSARGTSVSQVATFDAHRKGAARRRGNDFNCRPVVIYTGTRMCTTSDEEKKCFGAVNLPVSHNIMHVSPAKFDASHKTRREVFHTRRAYTSARIVNGIVICAKLTKASWDRCVHTPSVSRH